MKLKSFLRKAESVLNRLDAWLPPETREPDWNATAFRWQKAGNKGILESLPAPHTFPLSRLAAVDSQTAKLVRNTEQFLAGRPANNVLLTGSRGTGKSSLVKALLHEYGASGLRLIEVDKSDLTTLPALLQLLAPRPEKFYCFLRRFIFRRRRRRLQGVKNRFGRRPVPTLYQCFGVCHVKPPTPDA